MMNTRLLIRPISDIRILDTFYSGGFLGLKLALYDYQLFLVGDLVSLQFDDPDVNPQYNVDAIVTDADPDNNVIVTDVLWGESTVLQQGWIRNIVRCGSGEGGSSEIGPTIFDESEYYCGSYSDGIWHFIGPNILDATIFPAGPPGSLYEYEGAQVASFTDNLLWTYSGGSWSSSSPANGTYWYNNEGYQWYTRGGGGWVSPLSLPYTVDAMAETACWNGLADVAFGLTASDIPNCGQENISIEVVVTAVSGDLNVYIEGPTGGTGAFMSISADGAYSLTGPIGPSSQIIFGASGFDGCITGLQLSCGDCQSLRFNAVDLDLREDLQFPLSYQVADIREPQNRKSDFSKTITLPGTDNNNRVLAEMFEIGIDSVYDVNRKKDVFVLQDGLEILRGVAKIDRINRDDGYNVISYDISIQGKLADLFGSLKNGDGTDLRLEDLDLSEFDHLYNRQTIVDSWEGVITQSGATTTNFTVGPTYSVTDTLFAPGGRTIFALGSTHSLVVGDVVRFEMDSPGSTAVNFDASNGHHTVIAVGSTSVTVNLFFQSGAANTGVLSKWVSNGIGYVYPTINTSKGDATSMASFAITDYRPAVFAKTYVDKIFERIGYTYESDFLESDFFKRLVVPASMGDIQAGATGGTSTVTDYLLRTTDLIYPPIVYSDAGNETLMTFETLGGTPGTGQTGEGYFSPTGSNFNSTSTHAFTGVAYVTFAIDVHDVFESGTSTNPRLRKLQIPFGLTWFNGVANQSTSFQTWENPSDNSIPLAFGATTTVQTVTVALPITSTIFPGDVLTVTTNFGDIRFWNGTYFADWSAYSDIVNGLWAVVDESGTDTYVEATVNMRIVEAAFGRMDTLFPIEINSSIPRDFKARDFLTGLINLFNLYVEPDKNNERNLIIEPFPTYYESTDPLDWTDKVDVSQTIQIEPTSVSLPQNYLFTYTDDNDRFNKDYKDSWDDTYGEQLITRITDFNTSTATTKSFFSATPLVSVDSDISSVPTIVKGGTSAFTPMDSFRPRILYWTGLRYREPFAIDGVATSNQFGTNVIGYAGHLDNPYDATIDLDFGINRPLSYYYGSAGFYVTDNTLYNRFYRNYVDELTDKDSRLVTFKMKLKASDLVGLSFRKIYHVKDIAYKLQKVSDYDPLTREPCSVQFLKAKALPPFVGSTPPQRPSSTQRPGVPGVLGPAGGGGQPVVATGIDNTLAPNSSQAIINGNANTISRNSFNVIIDGDGNAIGATTRNVFIFGDNNVVPDGFDNVAIFGSGVTATSSDAVYFNLPILGASGGTFSGVTGPTGPTGPAGITGGTANSVVNGLANIGSGSTGSIVLTSPAPGATIGTGTNMVLVIGQSNSVGNSSNVIGIIGASNSIGNTVNQGVIIGANNVIPNNAGLVFAFGQSNVLGASGIAIGVGASGVDGEVAAGGTWNFQGAMLLGQDDTYGSRASRVIDGVIRFDRAVGPTTSVYNYVTGDWAGVMGPLYQVDDPTTDNATTVTTQLTWNNNLGTMGASAPWSMQITLMGDGTVNTIDFSYSLFYISGGVSIQLTRATTWTSGIVDLHFHATRLA